MIVRSVIKLVASIVIIICYNSCAPIADNDHWMLVDRENGCLPLSVLHKADPRLKFNNDPSDIFKTMKIYTRDIQIIPYIDYLDTNETPSNKPDAKKSLFHSWFKNKKDSIVLFSDSEEIEYIFFKTSLCNKLKIISPREMGNS